jgi:hypothetical protein
MRYFQMDGCAMRIWDKREHDPIKEALLKVERRRQIIDKKVKRQYKFGE